MKWKGKELETMGEIMKAVLSITDEEEAGKFMSAYKESSPHAKENIGYMTGYYPHEEATRILKLFKVTHPIFGDTIPTAGGAFKMGKRIGMKITRGK